MLLFNSRFPHTRYPAFILAAVTTAVMISALISLHVSFLPSAHLCYLRDQSHIKTRNPASPVMPSTLHTHIGLVHFPHPVPTTGIFQVVLASGHLLLKVADFAGSLPDPTPSTRIGLMYCESS